MINAKYSEKLEQKLREIQTGKLPEKTRKKKNISRMILFADVIFIIGIIIFFSNRMHQKRYETVSVESDGIEYILSAAEQENRLSITVNIVNKQNKNTVITFQEGNTGLITVKDSSEREISSFKFAEGIPEITLSPGESRTYLFNLDRTMLEQYAGKHPDVLIESQSKIFSLAKSDILLNITLDINIEKIVKTGLKYSLQVK
ncbi:MAG: hypothetical protein JW982_12070 [Spirochaetes bacterium]|nr:hypothetical protein [Spirochaetota bacterium]